jgi:hypothetical protein
VTMSGTRYAISERADPGPDAPRGSGRPRPQRRRHRRRRRHSLRYRRIRALILGVLAILLIWLAVSLGGALSNPALGTSAGARLAEWARGHGAATIVNWVENEWYRHHQPPVGGKPPKGAIVAPHSTVPHTSVAAPAHLTPPVAMRPMVTPAIAGEGQWSPAGRLVGGIPAVYETRLRPDSLHTSEVVGVAWMDTKLLRATLYSGSQIPGGGPFTHTAPVQPGAATSLVAAFNAGFLMKTANGGYYTDGKMIDPLRTGAASVVIYKDGSVTVGKWGTDVSMTSQVVSVRQNLDLLVEGGKPVAGLNASDTTQWGLTLGNAVYVWRSALGVTANGALVYVGGPGLNITDLANLLVDAGAVRGMELDINTDWVNLATYAPTPSNGAASASNGTDLLPTMAGAPDRYFQSWWARDFFTMSGR